MQTKINIGQKIKETLTFAEILQKEGVYECVGHEAYLIVLSKTDSPNGIIFINKDGYMAIPVDDHSWGASEFVKCDEEITITFNAK